MFINHYMCIYKVFLRLTAKHIYNTFNIQSRQVPQLYRKEQDTAAGTAFSLRSLSLRSGDRDPYRGVVAYALAQGGGDNPARAE